jgi:drug/metabolite transporter (DMT)-like permease
MVIATIAIALACGAIGRRAERTDRTTIVFALVAGVGFAGILVALGETDEASGIWPLVAARLTSIAIVGGFVAATGTAVRGVGPTWKLASLAGVLDITANVLYLLAVQRGLLSVVVVVVALYPVSTLCLAFSLDKERVTGSQAIGIGLALGALVLVSVSPGRRRIRSTPDQRVKGFVAVTSIPVGARRHGARPVHGTRTRSSCNCRCRRDTVNHNRRIGVGLVRSVFPVRVTGVVVAHPGVPDHICSVMLADRGAN